MPGRFTKVLDTLTQRGREKFPEDDPLHYLHVTPLQREDKDPPIWTGPERSNEDIKEDPGPLTLGNDFTRPISDEDYN